MSAAQDQAGPAGQGAPDPVEPFDPDTLPPHLRAKLDRISAIRWRMLDIIDRRRTERVAAEAEAARTIGQQQKEAAASPSTEIAAAS